FYEVGGFVAAAVVMLIETGFGAYCTTRGMLGAVLAVVVSLKIGVLATVFKDKTQSDRDS
ncbi:DUF368 domain-containing protein, partial [Lacticaseibacillus rhamnosus]